MKHTKEEISLCKQVAEKYKKPLENFDLVIGTHLSGEEFVGYFHKELTKEKLMKARLDEVMVGFCETAKTTKPMIPLWTISDCLEFFKKKGYKTVRLNEHEYGVGVSVFPEKELELGEGEYGNTRLEACLKVVLAVLKKGGK